MACLAGAPVHAASPAQTMSHGPRATTTLSQEVTPGLSTTIVRPPQGLETTTRPPQGLATMTTTTLDAPAKSTCGDKVTLTATVDPSTATGTVEFADQGGTPAFFQGFETDNNGWNVLGGQYDATRVASGTHGVTSRTGGFHAEAGQYDLDHDGGSAFSRWGGYSNTFPAGGYTTTIDVYLDCQLAGTVGDKRIDFSSAISNTDTPPHFRRDFVFNFGTEATGFVISASNNAGRSGVNPYDPGHNPIHITQTGWYTLKHRFYNVGGVLTCDFSVIDPSGNVLVGGPTWTRSDPSDVIGVTVGGNRYGWFAAQELPFLAFDNSQRVQGGLGSAPVTNGVATLSVTGLAVGGHAFVATYGGDANFASSSSAKVPHEVNPAPSAVSLTSSPNPSACNEKVTLTATVTPAGATGTVTFLDGTTSLGSSPVDASGNASLSVNFSGGGKHELTASYSGDACLGPSTSPATSHVVNGGASTVDLTSDINPSTCGQKVTLTATVQPAGATGTVTFLDGATALGSASVDAQGHATLSVTFSAAGKHDLSASYGGDPCHAAATSASYSQVVDFTASTVKVATDVNPSTCGQKVNLTATVQPAGATGTVTFFDGTTTLGTAPVDASGDAMLSVTFSGAGKHVLTASYSGDACHSGSTSPDVSQVVTPVATQTTLDAQPPKTACGDKVTLTAQVTPAGVTGTVTFLDGASAFGAAPVDANGQATLSVTALAVGSHSLTARYEGDGCFATSTSLPVSHDVNAIATTTSLTSDANPVKEFGKVNLIAHVDPAGATGTVEFFDGTTSLGTAPVDASGDATLSTTTLSAGTHSLTAQYGGDGCHAGSTSPAYSQTVVTNGVPQVTVIYPNGGENLIVGTTVTLQWQATDDNAVASVTLYISRDDGATYEAIATDIPNTGSYDWVVTGPGTNPTPKPIYSALFKVVAKDAEGQTGQDVSDAEFSIYDTGLTGVGGAPPVAFGLKAAWPNPAARGFATEFAVPRPATVRLSVLDLQGREVHVLAQGEYAPGRYPVSWNGRTSHGALQAGLYFLRLSTPDKQLLERVVVTN